MSASGSRAAIQAAAEAMPAHDRFLAAYAAAAQR
jgi:hypothetical protein